MSFYEMFKIFCGGERFSCLIQKKICPSLVRWEPRGTDVTLYSILIYQKREGRILTLLH